MLSNSRTSLRIRKKDFLFFIGWFICFPPSILFRISGRISLFLRYGGILYFIVLLLSHKFKLKSKNSKFKSSIVIFAVWSCFVVIWKSPGELANYLFDMFLPVAEVAIMIYCSTYNSESNVQSKLNDFISLYWLCVSYIIINFLLMVCYPSGLIRSSSGSAIERANWLLGSKNNLSVYLILAVTIVLFFTKETWISKVYSTALCVIALGSVMMAGDNGVEIFGGSSTGLVAITLLTITMIMNYRHRDIPLLSYKFKWILMFVVIINIVIITGTSIPLMQNFIINVLHRDMTFTGRIGIWQQVLYYISCHPFIGYGEQQLWYYIHISRLVNGTTYVYNLFLKQLVDFGIVGTFIFCSVFWNIPQAKNKKYEILIAGTIAFFICGMMDEVDYNFIFIFPMMISTVFVNGSPMLRTSNKK